jgi:hypothetical protein
VGRSRASGRIRPQNDLPALLVPLWEGAYGAFENWAGVMAHRPAIFKHVWSLLVDLADEAADFDASS